MSKKPRKKKGGNKKKRPQKRSTDSAAPKPPKKNKDAEALKSMGIGVLIFVAIAVLFFVKIGGETPVNHLVKAVSSAPKDGKGAKTPKGEGNKAPQDKHSKSDQADLDKLVNKKAGQ